MIIRKAVNEDYKIVREFYYLLTDALENAKHTPGWVRDVYPDQQLILGSICNGELFLAFDQEVLVGSMILNHLCNEGYPADGWLVDASPDQIAVIHALGVHPDYRRRGYAKALVNKAIEVARSERCTTLRLDVLLGNDSAKWLYEKMGFKIVHFQRMYYEDTGWTDYHLFEFPL